jgi:hypothetical protein
MRGRQRSGEAHVRRTQAGASPVVPVSIRSSTLSSPLLLIRLLGLSAVSHSFLGCASMLVLQRRVGTRMAGRWLLTLAPTSGVQHQVSSDGRHSGSHGRHAC